MLSGTLNTVSGTPAAGMANGVSVVAAILVNRSSSRGPTRRPVPRSRREFEFSAERRGAWRACSSWLCWPYVPPPSPLTHRVGHPSALTPPSCPVPSALLSGAATSPLSRRLHRFVTPLCGGAISSPSCRPCVLPICRSYHHRCGRTQVVLSLPRAAPPAWEQAPRISMCTACTRNGVLRAG